MEKREAWVCMETAMTQEEFERWLLTTLDKIAITPGTTTVRSNGRV